MNCNRSVATGATGHRVEGQRVIFEPLARLAPKGDALFKIQARGLAERDPRLGQPKSACN